MRTQVPSTFVFLQGQNIIINNYTTIFSEPGVLNPHGFMHSPVFVFYYISVSEFQKSLSTLHILYTHYMNLIFLLPGPRVIFWKSPAKPGPV